jgi:hypothetical protein
MKRDPPQVFLGSNTGAGKAPATKERALPMHGNTLSAPAGQDTSEQHSILVRQAVTAIDAAVTADDVKKVLAEWAGLAAYAREAKDKQLEADAAEIKMRAERRLGEMMQAQKETVGLNQGGRPKTGVSETPVSEKPATLAEAGVDKNLAKKARKEAAKSKEQFEEDVTEKKSGILEGGSKPKAVLDLEAGQDAGDLVEDPKIILANALDTISCHRAVVKAYGRIFKVSSLDDGAKAEISNAIGGLISKWKSLQTALAPKPPGNGKSPIAGFGYSIPSDLSVPDFLKRTPAESTS